MSVVSFALAVVFIISLTNCCQELVKK